MRLFIAIEVPLNVARHLRDIQTKLPFGLSLTKTYHLTLKFLGDVTPSFFESIKRKLKTISSPSFDATLSNIGFFPSSKDPRVVWVGVEPHETICSLQRAVDTALAEHFPRETAFQPHITLARVKNKTNIPSITPSPLVFPVNTFKLIESKLQKDGPIYIEHAAYSLTP